MSIYKDICLLVALIALRSRVTFLAIIGWDMLPHDLFPIHLAPKVRRTVLAEFQGRCRTVLEVARVPDAEWLKAPDMGPATLAKLRSLTPGFRRNIGLPPLAGLSDAELHAHSKALRKELSRIQEELKAHRTELQIRGISLPHYHMGARSD